MSDQPDGGFKFGGTLVDQGDMFLAGNEDESKALNYLGNTHGGMLKIGDQWYIFYHRQTNRHSYSRQACAEKLVQNPDGSFQQAEVTSCGLNDGPLKGEGRYEARIACNLWSKDGVGRYDGPSPRKRLESHPYFTQTGKDREDNGDQYIANMRDGAVAGFKYFQMDGPKTILVELRGTASGDLRISDSLDFANGAVLPVSLHNSTVTIGGTLDVGTGEKALYFQFRGTGAVDFIAFELQ